jgi:hypothetical protein
MQSLLKQLDALRDVPNSEFGSHQSILAELWDKFLDQPGAFRVELTSRDHPALAGTASRAATEFLRLLAESPEAAEVARARLRNVIVHACPSAGQPVEIRDNVAHFYQSNYSWDDKSFAAGSVFVQALLGQLLSEPPPGLESLLGDVREWRAQLRELQRDLHKTFGTMDSLSSNCRDLKAHLRVSGEKNV